MWPSDVPGDVPNGEELNTIKETFKICEFKKNLNFEIENQLQTLNLESPFIKSLRFKNDLKIKNF